MPLRAQAVLTSSYVHGSEVASSCSTGTPTLSSVAAAVGWTQPVKQAPTILERVTASLLREVTGLTFA